VNRTLKYQCFPAIAGNIADWNQAVELTAIWMKYYNEQRAHAGWINRGLPPLALYRLYEAAEGDQLQKLVNLGIVKLDAEWSIRMMGETPLVGRARPGEKHTLGPLEDDELPFALVLEKNASGEFLPDLREPPPGVPPPQAPRAGPSVGLRG
jgi:hypothetical protein